MPTGITSVTGRSHRFKDRTGQRYHRLLVHKYVGRDKWGNSLWSCVCQCGNRVTVRGKYLDNGHVTSCGCRRREVAAQLCRKLGKAKRAVQRTHGHCRCGHESPEYIVWQSMLRRAENCNGHNPAYAKVKVCKRWRSFINFYRDMGPRPAGTTLSRFGDAGDYCPGNCAWHTWKQQLAEHRKKKLQTQRRTQND